MTTKILKRKLQRKKLPRRTHQNLLDEAEEEAEVGDEAEVEAGVEAEADTEVQRTTTLNKLKITTMATTTVKPKATADQKLDEAVHDQEVGDEVEEAEDGAEVEVEDEAEIITKVNLETTLASKRLRPKPKTKWN